MGYGEGNRRKRGNRIQYHLYLQKQNNLIIEGFFIYLSDLIVNLWFFVQFYIIVEDVNDNAPLFDASEYTLEIKEHSTLGTEALRRVLF